MQDEWKLIGAEATLTVATRFGASISSILWDGFEFVNSSDHGRLISTAYSLNGRGEAENPTEGGSYADGNGPTSTTRIMAVRVQGKQLDSFCYPAYWYPFNGQTVSPDKLSRRITADWGGPINVFRHDVALDTAHDQTEVQIEGLTGYMNIGLSDLYTFNPADHSIKLYPHNIAPGPGLGSSTALPLILSTTDGKHAFGVYSRTPLYVEWMGAGGNSNKWDAAWQYLNPFPAGNYQWSVFYTVGTLEQVRRNLYLIVCSLAF